MPGSISHTGTCGGGESRLSFLGVAALAPGRPLTLRSCTFALWTQSGFCSQTFFFSQNNVFHSQFLNSRNLSGSFSFLDSRYFLQLSSYFEALNCKLGPRLWFHSFLILRDAVKQLTILSPLLKDLFAQQLSHLV